MRPNMNKYLRNEKWLCNIDVCHGARILAGILIVLFSLDLVLHLYFSYCTVESQFILWAVFDIIIIVTCILILIAQRFEHAWFHLPLILASLITAATFLFFAIFGLISMVFGIQKDVIYLVIPHDLLKSEKQSGSFRFNEVSESTKKIFGLNIYLLFVLESILLFYVCWICSRAYYQMKHFAEYIPYVTTNVNYKSPVAMSVETTSYSPQFQAGKPLIVDQTPPKDVVPVACKDLMEIV